MVAIMTIGNQSPTNRQLLIIISMWWTFSAICFILIINSNVLFQRFYMCHENGRSGRFTCPVGTLFSESLGMDYLLQHNSMTNSSVC